MLLLLADNAALCLSTLAPLLKLALAMRCLHVALLRLGPGFLLSVSVTAPVCRMISSSVGDVNHARFLIYCCAQGFYIFWGCLVAWHDAAPCYNAFRLSNAVGTVHVRPCTC